MRKLTSAQVARATAVGHRIYVDRRESERRCSRTCRSARSGFHVVHRIVAASEFSSDRLRQQVVSVFQAVNLLGPRRTKTLVLTAALQAAVTNTKSRLINANQFQKESRIRAIFAREAAREMGVDTETAYIAGLLQDFLLPLLTETYSADYAQILGQDLNLVEAERKCFGWDHADGGGVDERNGGFPRSSSRAFSCTTTRTESCWMTRSEKLRCVHPSRRPHCPRASASHRKASKRWSGCKRSFPTFGSWKLPIALTTICLGVAFSQRRELQGISPSGWGTS